MSAPAPAGEIDGLRTGLAGRYDIVRELGAGGMAVVYLAHDLQHDRDVALKVIRPEVGIAAGDERFHREIRLAARLVHPNILPLFDSGATDRRLWYTMPFIEGESLRARLDREKQLPIEEAIRITTEIAEALGHAHAKGILHRDIKPENILLSEGHALVVDFGIAKAIGDAGERITSTGITLGTPGYMSPEQSSGQQDLDARSDLYALASVSYEMLAGEPPFTGPTAQVVIARRLSQPAPSVSAIRPSVPGAIDAALRRALAPVPADRFSTTTDFSRALSSGVTRPPASRFVRSHWPLLAAAAAVLVIATTVLRFSGSRPPVTTRVFDSTAIRIAVLPFRSIGRDTSDNYLADGMTEEVSSALSNLAGLRVIDRSSVTPYAGGKKSSREIGAALHADALLTGDLQKSGDAVRVHVKLIDPATEESKWSQQYDHTSRDVFRIQSEVASKVAAVLRIQLAERESRSLSRPPTTNAEAYDAYLRAQVRGRERAERNRAEIDAAILSLRRAVKLDSSFASAWAELAQSDRSSVFLFDADPRRLDEADMAIRRAIAIDSSTALAWEARGDLEWNAVRGWHFAESVADVRHALALRPSLVSAHNTLSALYFHYGFMEQARRELEASLSLDPRDGCDDPTTCQGFSRPRVARVLWYEQKFDSALAVYDRIPFLGGFVWEKAVVLNVLGRSAEGLALLDSTKQRTGRESSDREAARGLLYASMGRSSEALSHLALAMAAPDSRSHFHHAQFTIACAYARLGRRRDAVEWLRRTANNGMPNYPLFRNDPNLRGLHGDPEYETLMTELRRQFDANARLVATEPTPTNNR